jgi:hypothetical protein
MCEEIAQMRSSGYDPTVIWLERSSRFDLWKDSRFTPAFQATQPQPLPDFYQGELSGASVVSFWPGSDNNAVAIVADISRLGRLEQYAVGKDKDYPLRVNVEHIDLEKAEEIFDKHPERWNRNKDGTFRSAEQAYQELMQYVIIDIAESFEFVCDDPSAGKVIRLMANSDSE